MDMIRPMVYLKEEEIVEACKANQIPSVRRVCPNDGYTQRQEAKELMEKFYKLYPMAHDNFLNSLSNEEQVSLWNKDQRSK